MTGVAFDSLKHWLTVSLSGNVHQWSYDHDTSLLQVIALQQVSEFPFDPAPRK